MCPVKIPLTRIMRHWRDVAFTDAIAPASFRTGLKLWAWLARRPRRYLRASAFAARLMRMFGHARIRSLPLFRGWFAERDLPAPAPASFQAQWRKAKP